jgi:WhiB family redox-sensing transcriptional regulator
LEPNFSLPFLNDEIGTPVCAETDPELFFPQEKDDPMVRHMTSVYYDEKGAKSLCQTCPYRVACLLYAVENREIGIWGGTTEGERRRLIRSTKGNKKLIVQIALSKKE